MKEQAENGCVPVEGSETTRVLGSGCHWRVHLQQQRQPRSAFARGWKGRGWGSEPSAERVVRGEAQASQRATLELSASPRIGGGKHASAEDCRFGSRGQGALGGECALLRRGLRGLAQASELRHPLLCLERGACATAGEDREKESGKSLCKWSLPGPMTTGSSGCGALWTFAAWSRLPL